MKYLYVIASLFVMSACSSVKPSISMSNQVSHNNVIAHRGAWKTNGLPENSIASLNQAIQINAAGSEFDVRMTSDDSLIINHDPHYNGMDIEKFTYDSLIKEPLKNGEQLPTLRAYILAWKKQNTNTRLICEIKPSGVSVERGVQIAKNVLKLVEELHVQDGVDYISFNYPMLLAIASINPNATTLYLNGDKSPEQIKADNIKGLNYYFTVFQKNPTWIDEAKKLNLLLNTWTVNDASTMQWFINRDFNFITTNEPELLAQLNKNKH